MRTDDLPCALQTFQSGKRTMWDMERKKCRDKKVQRSLIELKQQKDGISRLLGYNTIRLVNCIKKDLLASRLSNSRSCTSAYLRSFKSDIFGMFGSFLLDRT